MARLIVAATLCAVVPTAPALIAQRSEAEAARGLPGLVPTAHPPVPTLLRELWLVPGSSTENASNASTPSANLVRAARLAAAGQHRDAILLIDADALASTPLGPYARYLLATCLATLDRHAEAAQAFAALGATQPEGALSREWRLGAAKSAEILGDHATAATHYEALASDKTTLSAEALDGWGRTLTVIGQRERAVAVYLRLDTEFPASEFARHARAQAQALAAVTGQTLPRVFADEFARAERLLAARAYGDARLAFERLVSITAPADRELVDLRLASVNLTQKRYAQVIALTAPYRSGGEKQDEAGYLWAMAARRLGRGADFVAQARRLASEFPESRWSERALDELATYYVVQNQDDAAADIFRQIVDQFPRGATAERAYWRHGWRQYRMGDFATAAQVFEQGAASFPRSDYRPAYLYWSGRSHAQLGAVDAARARLGVAISDYGNSYYGRLATQWKERLDKQAVALEPTMQLASVTTAAPSRARRDEPAVAQGQDEARAGAAAQAPSQPPTPVQAPAQVTPQALAQNAVTLPPAPSAPGAAPDLPANPSIPTDALVRQLLALELYDAALLELDFAKARWGGSAALDATIAWVYHRAGDLRRGINMMKRAYPQYMAESGDLLPLDVQRVLFPLQYWDLIKRYSTERGIDPFLVAALVAQESTFQADVKSSANAYGLMQIIPSTGRRLAVVEGIKGFTTRSLINPDLNVRLGTAYFARLLNRFEHPHLALAGYNAGDSRVVRWTSQRPPLPADEWVEDIPFPETQNYVKRILGTAGDYRRVYGELGAAPLPPVAPGPPPRASTAAPATAKPTTRPRASTPGAKPTVKTPAAKKPAAKPAAKKPAATSAAKKSAGTPAAKTPAAAKPPAKPAAAKPATKPATKPAA